LGDLGVDGKIGSNIKTEILGGTNRLLSFYTTRTAQETTRPIVILLRVCCSNVCTEPLPSNDNVIQIQTHRLMGWIYEILR
jgi:hypothetical protein